MRSSEGLLSYLREWRGPLLGPSDADRVAAPANLLRAAASVEVQLGELVPRPPEPFALEQIRDRLGEAWSASRSIGALAPSDLRRAPWSFFWPHDQPELWIASLPGLVEAWLKWMDENIRARAVAALMREFIAVYPMQLACFERIRSWLERQVGSSRAPSLQKWAGRSARFGLLEADAPRRLTSSWWNGSEDFDEYARTAGLVPGLEQSELVRRSTEVVLDQAERRLRTGEADPAWLDRGLAWVGSGGRLRFPSLRVRTAEALLRPFLEAKPNPAAQQSIQEFLLRTIGHPGAQRDRWQGVSSELRDVLARWLVAGSLEDFFLVLDRTADRHHWLYRKAFWSSYLQKDLIDAAWIVLGRDARSVVRRNLQDSENDAGELRIGEGAMANHSVLLMRIGDLTIAEWSHSGRCRIWFHGNRSAPSLYEPIYRRRQLVDGCDWEKSHMGSERGTWQEAVAQEIARHTRVRMSRSHFMPRSTR